MQTKRQNEIIEEAVNIINTLGIQGLTIKNLSKTIGISEPAIYRHFESKTAILLAILDNFKEMTSFINQSVDAIKNSSIEKIEWMFIKITELFAKEPAHISVVFSEELFKNDKLLQQKIMEIADMQRQTVEAIIAEGQKKGEIRNDIDYSTLALIVIGTLRFQIKQWDLKNKHQHLVPEGQKLIENLKRILHP